MLTGTMPDLAVMQGRRLQIVDLGSQTSDGGFTSGIAGDVGVAGVIGGTVVAEAPAIGGTVSIGIAPTFGDETAPAPRRIAALVRKVVEHNLQCPTYAGPMYFPYSHNKGGMTQKTVRAAVLPLGFDAQPQLRPGSHTTLEPFELDSV